MNASIGSGGVGFLLKDHILDNFSVIIADDTYERIYWLKLTAKRNDFVLMICVCYLPPIFSCRYVNGAYCCDTLLSHVYRMQNDGLFMICGDFNGRCRDMPDYIDEDVDTISDRNVVDMTRNVYGELLCDFLIRAVMCMLNGRKYVVNDFTCKDASVVD